MPALTVLAGDTVKAGTTVTLTDTGSLAIAGAVTGPAGVTLTSSGGSITGGGIITTGTLTGSAATDVSLTGANQVNNLGNFAATAGSFTLIDVPALTVLAGDTVKAGTTVTLTDTGSLAIAGAVTGPAGVTLTSSGGSITGGGIITTGTLTGSAATDVTLTGANQVNNLGNFAATAGSFTLIDVPALTVLAGDTVNGGTTVTLTDTGSLAIAGAVTGPAGVTLTSSGGSITGGGVITTGTLTGSAATDVTLTGANQVNNLGNFAATAGSFTLIDVPALTVLAGDTVKAGTTVTLTDTGSLTFAGAVTGPAGVTLTSSGGSITGGGIITTGTLTGSAATDVTLTGANQVNNLGNFAATAGSFTLIDVPALTVLAGDTVKAGKTVTLTDTGALSLAGAVTGTAANLAGSNIVMPGTVTGPTSVKLTATKGSISAPGVITTATLTGSAAGSASLSGANRIDTLGNFTASSGFVLNDLLALTVTGVLKGGTGVPFPTPARSPSPTALPPRRCR